MVDLQKKFTEAAKAVSSNNSPMKKCVYCAYIDYLSDIDTNELPEEIQIIFESVKMRIISTIPPSDIGDDEAAYLAEDILYMEEIMHRNHGL